MNKKTRERVATFLQNFIKPSRQLAGLVILVLVVGCSIIAANAFSGAPVGKYNKDLTQPGYTLVAPLNNKNVFLVNNQGRIVHSWHTHNLAGAVTKLLPNGELLRTYQTPGAVQNFPMGGVGGGIQLLNWDSQVVWDYKYDTPTAAQHHDAIILPNGDVMFLAWVKKSKAEAIAAGVNPANLDPKSGDTWSDQIVEIDPSSKQIVWQWNAWEHLIQNFDKAKANYGDPAAHPELINANYYEYSQKPDWLHTNDLDFNADTNQVMISVREMNEFWIIDHSTTTAQAASHSGGNSGLGGDLLYRYGNPEAYGHGDKSDRTLYLQHDAHWIPDGLLGAGDILLFNNGDNVTGSRDYTSVLELKLPQTGNTYARTTDGTYAQPLTVWTYAPTGGQKFFSNIMGSAQRLPNGNTLITDAVHGRAIEVTAANQQVWTYSNPIFDTNAYDPSGPDTNNVFRFYKYAPDYSGFAGHDLTGREATPREDKIRIPNHNHNSHRLPLTTTAE